MALQEQQNEALKYRVELDTNTLTSQLNQLQFNMQNTMSNAMGPRDPMMQSAIQNLDQKVSQMQLAMDTGAMKAPLNFMSAVNTSPNPFIPSSPFTPNNMAPMAMASAIPTAYSLGQGMQQLGIQNPYINQALNYSTSFQYAVMQNIASWGAASQAAGRTSLAGMTGLGFESGMPMTPGEYMRMSSQLGSRQFTNNLLRGGIATGIGAGIGAAIGIENPGIGVALGLGYLTNKVFGDDVLNPGFNLGRAAFGASSTTALRNNQFRDFEEMGIGLRKDINQGDATSLRWNVTQKELMGAMPSLMQSSWFTSGTTNMSEMRKKTLDSVRRMLQIQELAHATSQEALQLMSDFNAKGFGDENGLISLQKVQTFRGLSFGAGLSVNGMLGATSPIVDPYRQMANSSSISNLTMNVASQIAKIQQYAWGGNYGNNFLDTAFGGALGAGQQYAQIGQSFFNTGPGQLNLMQRMGGDNSPFNLMNPGAGARNIRNAGDWFNFQANKGTLAANAGPDAGVQSMYNMAVQIGNKMQGFNVNDPNHMIGLLTSAPFGLTQAQATLLYTTQNPSTGAQIFSQRQMAQENFRAQNDLIYRPAGFVQALRTGWQGISRGMVNAGSALENDLINIMPTDGLTGNMSEMSTPLQDLALSMSKLNVSNITTDTGQNVVAQMIKTMSNSTLSKDMPSMNGILKMLSNDDFTDGEKRDALSGFSKGVSLKIGDTKGQYLILNSAKSKAEKAGIQLGTQSQKEIRTAKQDELQSINNSLSNINNFTKGRIGDTWTRIIAEQADAPAGVNGIKRDSPTSRLNMSRGPIERAMGVNWKGTSDYSAVDSFIAAMKSNNGIAPEITGDIDWARFGARFAQKMPSTDLTTQTAVGAEEVTYGIQGMTTFQNAGPLSGIKDSRVRNVLGLIQSAYKSAVQTQGADLDMYMKRANIQRAIYSSTDPSFERSLLGASHKYFGSEATALTMLSKDFSQATIMDKINAAYPSQIGLSNFTSPQMSSTNSSSSNDLNKNISDLVSTLKTVIGDSGMGSAIRTVDATKGIETSSILWGAMKFYSTKSDSGRGQ